MLVAHRSAANPTHNRELAAWLHNHLPAVQVHGHAAGVLGFDLIPDLTAAQFGSVVQPKVRTGTGFSMPALVRHASLR